MELVDTHCHIQSAGLTTGERSTREIWAKDKHLTRQVLVKNAVEAGVTRLICVGCDLADSQLAVEFVQSQSNCWASIGLHPHEAQHYSADPAKLEQFKALVTKPKVVAVGECGLDYYYDHSPKTAQIPVLRAQIELALEYQLPLIFHVREAFDDFWPIFDSYQGIRGVLHSFTDNRENLNKALERGLYIGVNGIATFAKDPAQHVIYRTIPLQKLLLETDAPFLTPTPYRGTINESKRVGTIAEFMASLRDESLEHLAAVTTHNAQTLFGLK
ncbi:MAG TPA: TatD family hydrolase [Candidatus Saccharimonadales bacterium]|nr:TatD family hydrolase [Candidatus Saccharimonadales bacterium]